MGGLDLDGTYKKSTQVQIRDHEVEPLVLKWLEFIATEVDSGITFKASNLDTKVPAYVPKRRRSHAVFQSTPYCDPYAYIQLPELPPLVEMPG